MTNEQILKSAELIKEIQNIDLCINKLDTNNIQDQSVLNRSIYEIFEKLNKEDFNKICSKILKSK